MEETNHVKVLERALTILDLLRDEEIPLGVNEIAKRCGISPATTFRLLKTLLNYGWIYQNNEEKYSLGYKITAVTEKKSFLLMLKEVSYYTMTRLSETEHEAMNLVVRELDRCYILGQSRTKKIADYVPPIGTVLPFHTSACGKMLLSELEEPLLGSLLDTIDFHRMTEKTITDRGIFLEELEKSGIRDMPWTPMNRRMKASALPHRFGQTMEKSLPHCPFPALLDINRKLRWITMSACSRPRPGKLRKSCFQRPVTQAAKRKSWSQLLKPYPQMHEHELQIKFSKNFLTQAAEYRTT